MRTLKLGKLSGTMAAIFLGCALSGAAFADVTVTVDTIGNGTVNGPNGSFNMGAAAASDPGPGGAASVLSYTLLNPPDLVAGDVQLLTGGVVTDLIRFNAPGTGNPAYPASLLYYSQGNDGASHLATQASPPNPEYPNIVSINKGSVYTPGPGQPGFVSTMTTHYNFNTVNCALSINPGRADFTQAGGSGSFTITTGVGCPASVQTTSAFVTFTVNGNVVNFTVAPFAGPGLARGATITVNGPLGAVFNIAESGPPPVFDFNVQPGKLQFNSSSTTAPPPQVLNINGADGTPFDISVDVPWITVTRSSPTSPSTITVTVAPGTLKAGSTNSGNITIKTGNGNFVIPVIYFIQGLPSLVASPASLTFNLPLGGPAPPTQQLKISASNLTAIPLSISSSNFITVSPSGGNSTLTLTVGIDPTKVTAGSLPGNITVTAPGVTNSPLVVSVTANVAGAGPVFNSTSVVNAASFQPGALAPGGLFTIFGTGLSGASTPVSAAPGTPLQTSLGGSFMTIGGVAVPLEFVSSTQINAQIPFEAVTGDQDLVLTSNGVPRTVRVHIAPVAPGTFVVNGRGAILNQDSSVNGPGNGATGGSIAQVFFTGQGQVTPEVGSGMPASLTALAYSKAHVTATINSVPVDVVFAGLAPGYIGLAQANVKVPVLPANDYTLVLFVDGVPANAVNISIQ